MKTRHFFMISLLLACIMSAGNMYGRSLPDIKVYGNLYWLLTEDGTLVIEGNGRMKEDPYLPFPWHSFKSKISSIVLSEGITMIADGAFYECTNLKAIIIPKSVKKIGGYAFGGCSKLTSITIPEGVQNIEESTFSCCFNLHSIDLPSSIKSIKTHAFNRCTSLKQINFPNGLRKIGFGAFYNCNSLLSQA